MLKQANGTSRSKREFSVADEHMYNRSGPVRWILSHLLRYPHLLVSFLVCRDADQCVLFDHPAAHRPGFR